jgi:hypothetical protein
MYECFYCGAEFYKSDSIAANTEEQYATTYCSRRCCDLDIESMKQDGEKSAKDFISSMDAAKLQSEQNTETKTVGGFTLKIKKGE